MRRGNERSGASTTGRGVEAVSTVILEEEAAEAVEEEVVVVVVVAAPSEGTLDVLSGEDGPGRLMKLDQQ